MGCIQFWLTKAYKGSQGTGTVVELRGIVVRSEGEIRDSRSKSWKRFSLVGEGRKRLNTRRKSIETHDLHIYQIFGYLAQWLSKHEPDGLTRPSAPTLKRESRPCEVFDIQTDLLTISLSLIVPHCNLDVGSGDILEELGGFQ